ncbi:hypothetical protein GF336_05620 [Candidatus Woesearchaeota archaeon]|nr:hypothetical protein [Candidatus Woesearchaeota archaeon]
MNLSLLTHKDTLKNISKAASRIIHRSMKDDQKLISFQSVKGSLKAVAKNTCCFAEIYEDLPENSEGKGSFSISLEELKTLAKQNQDIFYFESDEEDINIYMPSDNIMMQRSLKRITPEDIPNIPAKLDWQSLDDNYFPELLLQAGEFAEEYSDITINKNTICFDGKNNKIVATDGKMMYIADMEISFTKKKTAVPLTKFLKTRELVTQAPVEAAYHKNKTEERVYLRFNNIIYSTEVLGSYPDYPKVIPNGDGLAWDIIEDAQMMLMQSIEDLPVNDKNYPIKLSFSKGKVKVEGKDNAFFVMKDKNISFSISLKVNSRIFSNIISMSFDTIRFFDEATPIVFDDEQTGRKALLMPLRG